MWRVALHHALLTLLIAGVVALTIWAGTAAPEVTLSPPVGAAVQGKAAEAETTRETGTVQERSTATVSIISPKTGDNFWRWCFG